MSSLFSEYFSVKIVFRNNRATSRILENNVQLSNYKRVILLLFFQQHFSKLLFFKNYQLVTWTFLCKAGPSKRWNDHREISKKNKICAPTFHKIFMASVSNIITKFILSFMFYFEHCLMLHRVTFRIEDWRVSKPRNQYRYWCICEILTQNGVNSPVLATLSTLSKGTLYKR